jgi:uncharacterized membrane-anchored protein
MNAPLAISHTVMVCDAAEREASRAHVAALLRDHHLPLPDAQSTHMRMDLGPFRIRWELHTEFVTWTFTRAMPRSRALVSASPRPPLTCCHKTWLAGLPGPVPGQPAPVGAAQPAFGNGSLVKHVLHEDTLVASTVADGHGEVYTDFAVHADGFSRMVLLAGSMTPRRWAAWCSSCWRSTPTAWPPCWACLPRAKRRPCWPMPSGSWPSWPTPSALPAA